MIVLCALCLLTSEAFSHLVTESSEETTNITTLYPVPHRINHTHHQANNSTDINENNKVEATVWKIETTFAESKLQDKEEDNNGTDSREHPLVEEPENKTKEFKPSQHLGDFFEDEIQVPPTNEPFGFLNFFKKSPSRFHSSPKFPEKHPNELKLRDFPYKIESPILTKAKSPWKPNAGSLESRLPAGGLYKHPDPFTDKPTLVEDDADFGLDFGGDFKETAIKKRPPNPWKQVVQLLTAFIPVGLIISALTPQVITVHSSAPYTPYSNRYARGADNPPAAPRQGNTPPMSERCRRRLLCELLADKHYVKHYVQSPRDDLELSSSCTRFRCNSPETLVTLLAYLLHPLPQTYPGNT